MWVTPGIWKAAYLLIITLVLTGSLLAGCQSSPAGTFTATSAFTELEDSAPAASPSVNPTSTHTSTPSHTPTVTPLPSLTPTSSITPSPTEDLSFYDVADCLPSTTGYQRVLVSRVIDGDSIEVQLTGDITATVRYIGIDTPESGFPFYDQAMQANSDLVLGRQAVLVKDQSETEQYGRLLRYVIVDDALVNQELVRRGFARASNYPPDESCKNSFAAAEQDARQASVGLWAPSPSLEPSAGQVIILEVNKREEWVDIQNVGDYDVDLAGWILVSERGQQECPLSGTLTAGETLRIWAMQPQGPGLSCGYNSPIWNNSEPDPAVLYNAQGVEVSRK